MCDASDYAIGAILDQIKSKVSMQYTIQAKFWMIHKLTMPQPKNNCYK